MATSDPRVCLICNDNLDSKSDEYNKIGRKGLTSLVRFSNLHGDERLSKKLKELQKIDGPSNIYVHIKCRRDYTNQNRLRRNDGNEELNISQRRSGSVAFDWKSCCLFCGEVAVVDTKHPKRTIIHRCETLTMKETILARCNERADNWGNDVHYRLQDCIDLVANEAVYHLNCYRIFFLHGDTPKSTPHRQSEQQENFEKLCLWLDEQVELFTVTDLYDRMCASVDRDKVYSLKWFRMKLKEKYKETIFFAEHRGKSSLVCFKDSARDIISEKWFKERKQNIDEEKRRIIDAAARLIKSEIRSITFPTDVYPSKSDIENCSTFLPSSLQYFMELLIPSKLKQASIGQCILKAMKPNSVIPPLQFGLGVEVSNAMGSKWLNNELSRLGFALSYDEVLRFKQAVLLEKENQIQNQAEGGFTQWVADNVDHNLDTLDGKGTFHGMGIISCAVGNSYIPTHRIERPIKAMKMGDLPSENAVTIHQYRYPASSSMQKIRFSSMNFNRVEKPSKIDLLWHCVILRNNEDTHNPRSNWSGFMSRITEKREHPPKTTVTMMPIIDLNPTDEHCIYSTLLHVMNEAKKINLPSPCITMDQPLWYKAVEIATSLNLKIVIRLGGFHTLMNFVGSVGTIMTGSGLETLLETIYARNTVVHMLSGKAISRALRGHFLADAALTMELLHMIFPATENEAFVNSWSQEQRDDILSKPDKNALFELYDQLCNHIITENDIEKSSVLKKVDSSMRSLKKRLSEKSRTAKLWLSYMEYIGIIKSFIRAERTGDWLGHLAALEMMLPLFAATGHINYAKSARLYLQKMQSLPQNHPWLYQQFVDKGYHTVRRSDTFWAGLWTDLVIEQTMMRSIKSRGGLTRGSGLTESVRMLWVSTLHECSAIRQAMTSITGAVQSSSEQHVDLSLTRIQRDSADLMHLSSWLQKFNPFDTKDSRLRSLSSGLAAKDGDGINCDEANSIGRVIQENLNNVIVAKAKIPRSKQTKSLQFLTQGIILNNESIPVDPSVLFSRLILLIERKDKMESYFTYELTPVPTSLFKDNYMRHADKSSLAKALLEKVMNSEIEIGQSDILPYYVLDGGALLHRVFWHTGTYMDIVKQYLTYVKTKYGICTIIFDGYQMPSTKDHEHSRRRAKAHLICPDVVLAESNVVRHTKQLFLSNNKNKQQLINLLAKYFTEEGHQIYQCNGDADTTIVDVALKYALTKEAVTVVAEDTDILILLLYFWNKEMSNVSMRSEPRKGQELKEFNIGQMAKKLNENIVKHILFIHAWGGCDTTSAIFNQGKNKIMKLVESGDDDIIKICSVFDQANATQDEIGEAGIKLFAIMNGARKNESLAYLRKVRCTEMVVRSTKGILPEYLPPTEDSARQHSLRVYLQMMLWKDINSSIEPTDWGWRQDDSCLVPVMSTQPPAPDDILKVVRCNCKTGTKHPCGTTACSCRKNGLACVAACGQCHGRGCNNEYPMDLDEEPTDCGTNDLSDANIIETLC